MMPDCWPEIDPEDADCEEDSAEEPDEFLELVDAR